MNPPTADCDHIRISDFRLKDLWMQSVSWVEQNVVLISTSRLVLLGIFQSQIRNLQSTIHNSPSWRPRVFLRLRSGQAHLPCDVPFRYASDPTPCGCRVARPSARSRDVNSWNIRAKLSHYTKLVLDVRDRFPSHAPWFSSNWACSLHVSSGAILR